MHGIVMLLLFGTPVVWGFANYILPLQIGAPDVAFPRLNAFGFWITLIGGIAMLAGFLTPGDTKLRKNAIKYPAPPTELDGAASE